MKINRWEEYQEFFQLIILRYLVAWFSLVPVIAGLVSQLPNPLPVKISNFVYSINLTLPFHWQLLWISSLFFVIALVIYKIRCPKFIKKYNNFSDYLEYQHHPRWLVWEASDLLKVANIEEKKKLCKRLDEKGYIKEIPSAPESLDPEVKGTQTIIKFNVEDTSYEFGMPVLGNAANDDSEKDIFYELFGRYSASRLYARLSIKFCLIISLLLFIIVLIQHIISGGSFVWDWLIGLNLI